jgi:hypothetical protein
MWQDGASKGIYSHDAAGGISGGSALAAGPTNGCFIQSFPVDSGGVYAAGSSSRLKSAGCAFMLIRWQDSDGGWTLEQEDRYTYFPDDPREWTNALEIVRVPDGAGKLVLLLSAKLPSREDQCWFDNVEVYKIW